MNRIAFTFSIQAVAKNTAQKIGLPLVKGRGPGKEVAYQGWCLC